MIWFASYFFWINMKVNEGIRVSGLIANGVNPDTRDLRSQGSGNLWKVIIEYIGNFSAGNQFGAIFLHLKIILTVAVWFQDFVNDFSGRLSVMNIVIELINVVLHFLPALFYYFLITKFQFRLYNETNSGFSRYKLWSLCFLVILSNKIWFNEELH